MNNNLRLALGVALVAIAGTVVWYVQKPQPMPVATAENGEPAVGEPLADVKIPATLSSAAQIGKLAFEAKCAVCHGANAAGQQGVAPPLVNIIYRPGHHADAAFLMAAQNGVQAHHWRFGNMPQIKGVTRADVIGIVAYIRALQEENGIN